MARDGGIKPGIYERLVTEELARLLGELDADLVSREPLDPADSHEMLARHLALVARALRSVPARSDHPLQEQLRVANRIIEAIAGAAKDDHLNLVTSSADVLHAVAAPTDSRRRCAFRIVPIFRCPPAPCWSTAGSSPASAAKCKRNWRRPTGWICSAPS